MSERKQASKASRPNTGRRLLGAVGVTVVGLAYLESGRATGSGAHGPQSADAIASHREEAAHGKPSSSSSDSKAESESEPQQSGADKPEAADGAAEQGEAPSSKEEGSQPSADGADAATKSEEKKKKGEGNEESETTVCLSPSLSLSLCEIPQTSNSDEHRLCVIQY